MYRVEGIAGGILRKAITIRIYNGRAGHGNEGVS